MTEAKTFESTYTRYPFAPLVELGLTVAGWLKRTFGGNSATANGSHHTGSKPGALGQAA